MESPRHDEAVAASERLVHHFAGSPAAAEAARAVHARLTQTARAVWDMDAAAIADAPDAERPAAEAAAIEARRMLASVEDFESGPARMGDLDAVRADLIAVRAYGEGVLLHVDEITRAIGHQLDGPSLGN